MNPTHVQITVDECMALIQHFQETKMKYTVSAPFIQMLAQAKKVTIQDQDPAQKSNGRSAEA